MSGSTSDLFSGGMGALPAAAGNASAVIQPMTTVNNLLDMINKGNQAKEFLGRVQAGQAYQQSIDPATGQVDPNKLGNLLRSAGPYAGLAAPGEQQGANTAIGGNIANQANQLSLQDARLQAFGQILSGLADDGSDSPSEVKNKVQTFASEYQIPATMVAPVLNNMPDDPAKLPDYMVSSARAFSPIATQAADLSPGISGSIDTGGQVTPITSPLGAAQGQMLNPLQSILKTNAPTVQTVQGPGNVPQVTEFPGQATAIPPINASPDSLVPVGGVPSALMPPAASPGAGALPAAAGSGSAAAPISPAVKTMLNNSGIPTPGGGVAPAPATAPAPGTVVLGAASPGPGAVEAATAYQPLHDSLVSTLNTAGQQIGKINATMAALNNVTSGPMAQGTRLFQNLAQELGLPGAQNGSQYDTASKFIAGLQAALPDTLGQATDFKLQLNGQASASMTNSNLGNNDVLATAKGVLQAQYLAAAYAKQQGVLDNLYAPGAAAGTLKFGDVGQVIGKINPMVYAYENMAPANQREFLKGLGPDGRAGFKKDWAFVQQLQQQVAGGQ